MIGRIKNFLRGLLTTNTATATATIYLPYSDIEDEDEPIIIWLKDPKQLLIYLYQDLRRVSHVVSQDFILHTFDDPSHTLRGIPAARARMDELIAANVHFTIQTMVMECPMGAVMGRIATPRGRRGTGLNTSFCGVWRFNGEGRPCEHWETLSNHQPQALAEYLREAREERERSIDDGSSMVGWWTN